MMEKRFALVACNGGCRNESCAYGCLGCGVCVSVCPAEAIALNENGVAEVDETRCLGCGACADACPQETPAPRRSSAFTRGPTPS